MFDLTVCRSGLVSALFSGIAEVEKESMDQQKIEWVRKRWFRLISLPLSLSLSFYFFSLSLSLSFLSQTRDCFSRLCQGKSEAVSQSLNFCHLGNFRESLEFTIFFRTFLRSIKKQKNGSGLKRLNNLAGILKNE
jgi:hypothetical protein